MKSTCIDFHQYVRPQENGNKTDVRWMALSNDEETGLLIVGMPLLSMSALHYTMEDLDPGEQNCNDMLVSLLSATGHSPLRTGRRAS